jgi:hypothetical protein
MAGKRRKTALAAVGFDIDVYRILVRPPLQDDLTFEAP